MVTQLGMSQSVGLVALSRRRNSFLQTPEANARDYSETTAQAVDEEVRRILDQGYEQALNILGRDRQFLEAIARRLLEKEVMDSDELRELLGLPPEKSDEHKPEIGHAAD